jgi:hypothetical protein
MYSCSKEAQCLNEKKMVVREYYMYKNTGSLFWIYFLLPSIDLFGRLPNNVGTDLVGIWLVLTKCDLFGSKTKIKKHKYRVEEANISEQWLS